MRIVNLVPKYIEFVLSRNDPAAYERTDPALFTHYYTYWANHGEYKEKDIRELQRKTDMLLAALPRVMEHIKETAWPGEFPCDVILFVGQGSANGHAIKREKNFAAWIAVEMYQTELQAEIFLTHELVHALHYHAVPEFYFTNNPERCTMSRQLITEGIATLYTIRANQCDLTTALWADYLTPDEKTRWFDNCFRANKKIFTHALENFHRFDEKNGFFTMSDTSDILCNRAGYYAGLIMIWKIIDTYHELMNFTHLVGKNNMTKVAEDALRAFVLQIPN